MTQLSPAHWWKLMLPLPIHSLIRRSPIQDSDWQDIPSGLCIEVGGSLPVFGVVINIHSALDQVAQGHSRSRDEGFR